VYVFVAGTRVMRHLHDASCVPLWLIAVGVPLIAARCAQRLSRGQRSRAESPNLYYSRLRPDADTVGVMEKSTTAIGQRSVAGSGSKERAVHGDDGDYLNAETMRSWAAGSQRKYP